MAQKKDVFEKLKSIEMEIRNIKTILTIMNSKLIEIELNKICSTNDRKLMWIHIDGNKTQDEIAKLVGKTQAAVSYFISNGKDVGLIDDIDGLARKTINYIPSNWLNLIK